MVLHKQKYWLTFALYFSAVPIILSAILIGLMLMGNPLVAVLVTYISFLILPVSVLGDTLKAPSLGAYCLAILVAIIPYFLLGTIVGKVYQLTKNLYIRSLVAAVVFGVFVGAVLFSRSLFGR